MAGYDTWKAHNPADEFLGPEPSDEDERPEPAEPILSFLAKRNEARNDPHHYAWYPKLDDGREFDGGLIEARLEYERCSGGYEVTGVIVGVAREEIVDLLKEPWGSHARRIGAQIAADVERDPDWQRAVYEYERELV